MKISDHHAQAFGVPKGRHVIGHRIVVEGYYVSSEIEPHTGHAEKKRVRYSESFDLKPADHLLHGQGALGHILSDGFLAERLSAKDKNFRAIATHVISKHENILEPEPAPADEPAPAE